jgi:predicted acylesterase/phospholipase RssA
VAPGREGKPYLNLVDVTFRALQLQRFRDAALERRLTELFTRTMPPGKAVFETEGERYVRVWVAPVEPETPMELGDRVARCGGEAETRRLMLEAVADGCRGALEVMIRQVVPAEQRLEIPCRTAVEKHLERPGRVSLPLLGELDLAGPGNPSAPPGLPEVCAHCCLRRPQAHPNGPDRAEPGSAPARPPGEKRPAPATLAFREWSGIGPAWPQELEVEPEGHSDPDPHFSRPRPEIDAATVSRLTALRDLHEDGGWPLPSDLTGPGHTRPLVNFLFSGGVFRGVYQLGTLAAVSVAGLRPDLIAGESVGSITGAMVAQALTGWDDRDQPIARLAATYLAMDHLILTDRFADFIRGLTLRAASTPFSLRQVDRFLRRYDHAGSDRFNEEARIVMAGLERLFGLSPFELKRLVKALRLREWSQAYELLRAYVQEWLDRMGVGNQILGAEPLTLLIVEHVLERLPGEESINPELAGFDRYLTEAGIFLFATTTNLTQGQLELVGAEQLLGTGRATLLEGLLASSAFPGIFRPRWSWELMPASTANSQYIDGGVMDNLPLDAVAHFLRLASEPEVGTVARRPTHRGWPVPHLLFAPSLEIAPPLPTADQLARYPGNWPAVWRRARQLRYNKKLELYTKTQQAMRAIYQAVGDQAFVPLDLEVVTVRPRWLPSTFGFHPMLGFERDRAAASIAHGCATALLELGRTARDQPAWAAGWGLDPARLPPDPPRSYMDPIVPRSGSPGGCWFRPGADCPFSRSRLAKVGLPERTRDELERIHHLCGREETHAPA